jgi:hypothetical protein
VSIAATYKVTEDGGSPDMRIPHTLDQLGIARIRHHRGHGNRVVIESAFPDHNEVLRAGQERWRAASYTDPWPDRA